MNKAGIIIDRIGLSQLGVNLGLALNQIEQTTDIDVIVFHTQWDRLPLVPRFAMMQIFEAWGFFGPVIATNLATAQILLNCPCPKPKYFYVWDLEWLYTENILHMHFAEIYQNPDLKLIARSKSHADLLSKTWQKPVDIMDDFNHETLIRLIKQ